MWKQACLIPRGPGLGGELHKQPGTNDLERHKYKLHLLGGPPLLTAGSFQVRQRWCCIGDELDPLSIQTVNRERMSQQRSDISHCEHFQAHSTEKPSQQTDPELPDH